MQYRLKTGNLKTHCVAAALVKAMREGVQRLVDSVADQIEAQTKPVRIPEPELWGVVEATVEKFEGDKATWVHDPYGWVSHSGYTREWRNLIDPTLIREGVES